MPIPDEDTTTLDRQLAIPLYHQLFLQLREEIVSGTRAFGSRMPTEQELSDTFGVSRITARRALDELANNHFVARKRRVGTRVIFQSPAKPIEGSIGQALESLVSFGRNTRVTVLEFDKVPARPPVSDALQIESGAMVVRVARVRSLEDGPIGHFVSYIPSGIGLAITRQSLRNTPMLSLLDQAGIKIGSAVQTISATLADATLAALLEVEIHSPLLRVSRTMFDTNREPVQLILAHFRPDRYQIRLDLHA